MSDQTMPGYVVCPICHDTFPRQYYERVHVPCPDPGREKEER